MNFLINLTLILSNSSPVKECEVTQKIFDKILSMTVVYPPNGFSIPIVLSNVTPRILAIFGDFIHRYEDKSLNLRW